MSLGNYPGNYILDNGTFVSESDKRQAGAEFCPNLRSLQDEIESFNDVGVKSIHRFQNTLPLKGLSLIESYIEGILWIAVEYRPAAANEVGVSGFLVLLNGQSHARDGVTCFLPEFVEKFSRFPDDHICGCGDKDVMLVSDVQKVDTVEHKLPGFVRLYLIKDDVDNSIRRRHRPKR